MREAYEHCPPQLLNIAFLGVDSGEGSRFVSLGPKSSNENPALTARAADHSRS